MKPEGGPTKIITIWQDWRGEERSRVPGALKGLREVFPYARAGIEEQATCSSEEQKVSNREWVSNRTEPRDYMKHNKCSVLGPK